jgi:hypothetical protein
MDVSKRAAKVCVRVAGRRRRKTVETVRTWASTTNAILQLREHLIAEQVTLLAQLAKRRLRTKIPALTEALTGRFREHHAFLTRMYLEVIEQRTRQIEQLTPSEHRFASKAWTRPRFV